MINNKCFGGGYFPLYRERRTGTLTCSPFRLSKEGGLRCKREVISRG